MAEIAITAKVDTTDIDKAIEKVERLKELLAEAKSLADDLASCELGDGSMKTEISEKSLYCLGWHLKTMHENAKREHETSFSEPCSTCPRYTQCKARWLSAAAEVSEKTGIVFSWNMN